VSESPGSPLNPDRLDPAEVEALRGLGPHLDECEERFQQLDGSIQSIHHEFQRSLDTAITQLMARFDSLPIAASRGVTSNRNQSVLLGTLPPPVDIPSRWPWVELSILQTISDGDFDIHSLSKLFREEQPRRKHRFDHVDAFLLPVQGGIVESVTSSQTKMQTAFPEFHAFVSAWLVYVAIRTAYEPERGPGLMHWTERLYFYVYDVKYPWFAVLRYVIAYFQAHNKHPADQWFSSDAELVSHTLSHSQRDTTVVAVSPTKRNSPTKPANLIPIANQICLNWNKEGGCQIRQTHGRECMRRHVCRKCESSAHKVLQCPSKKE
jgi:hypothetical protein